MMMALHIWSLSHGIASLFGRGDAARRALPMSPEELLEAGVLLYLRGLGLTAPDLIAARPVPGACAMRQGLRSPVKNFCTRLETAWHGCTYVNVINIHREVRYADREKLDNYGKPAWIALIDFRLLGLVAAGLAILAFSIWSGRMGCWSRHRHQEWQDRMEQKWAHKREKWARHGFGGGGAARLQRQSRL